MVKQKKAKKDKGKKKFVSKKEPLDPKYPAQDLILMYGLSDYKAKKFYIKEKISPDNLFTKREFKEIIEKRFGKRR